MIKLPQIYYDVKKFLKHKNEMDALYQEQLERNKGKRIQYWNWWEDERTAYWLEQFMESRGILKNTDKTIALCSVFGEREVLERVKADVRIFFSGENLHNPRHAQYSDYMLSGNKPFDLGIGFDDFVDNQYLRFPLWLIYMFAPDSTNDDIRKRCADLRYPIVKSRDKFSALIARADWYGMRTKMYKVMSKIGKVDCPSMLFHNDESLAEQYGDDKMKYLQQYKFNICPENTNARGYTTEKVFESIAAGCLPIYWGSCNNPEPEILNSETIIFWEKENEGVGAIEQIRELAADSKQMEDFMKRPRLLPNAEDYTIRYFESLESKLKKLI